MGHAWIYILRCADGLYYVGSARNLEARMDGHLAGRGAKFTRRRLPVELVYAQECDNIGEARSLKRQVHGWSHAKKEALVNGDFHLLPGLARGRRR